MLFMCVHCIFYRHKRIVYTVNCLWVWKLCWHFYNCDGYLFPQTSSGYNKINLSTHHHGSIAWRIMQISTLSFCPSLHITAQKMACIPVLVTFRVQTVGRYIFGRLLWFVIDVRNVAGSHTSNVHIVTRRQNWNAICWSMWETVILNQDSRTVFSTLVFLWRPFSYEKLHGFLNQ